MGNYRGNSVLILCEFLNLNNIDIKYIDQDIK